jgi:methanogenic corrinoid protein MtbC1
MLTANWRAELKEDVLQGLARSVTELDIGAVKKRVEDALQLGLSAEDVILAVNKGMRSVGQKYEEGEYFLSELIVAGEVMKAGIEIVKPLLQTKSQSESGTRGTIVVGTVKGDIHDLGKNLFVMFASVMQFKIEDLGIDVAADRFVERTAKSSARIVALSALMSTTQTYMKDVVEALEESGIRNRIKVIVGGAPITKEFAGKIGADAGVNDAMKGAEICCTWAGNANA